jgi:ATP-dependent helicase/nuclease subunit A
VRRELPVYLAVPARDFDPAAPASDDPEDRVMVRSRIDVLLPGERAGEWEIVDYKTDRLDSAAAVDERAAYYRPQMEMYRQAVKAITGREVAKVHLVFLSAKAIRTL